MFWLASHFISIQQVYNFIFLVVSHCISLVLFYPVGIFLSICLLIFLRVCFYIYREEIRYYVILIETYLEPVNDFFDAFLNKYKFFSTALNTIRKAINVLLYSFAVYLFVFNVTYLFFVASLVLNILGYL